MNSKIILEPEEESKYRNIASQVAKVIEEDEDEIPWFLCQDRPLPETICTGCFLPRCVCNGRREG